MFVLTYSCSVKYLIQVVANLGAGLVLTFTNFINVKSLLYCSKAMAEIPKDSVVDSPPATISMEAISQQLLSGQSKCTSTSLDEFK